MLRLGVAFLVINVSFRQLLLRLSALFCRPSCRATRRIITRNCFLDQLPSSIFPLRIRRVRYLVVSGGSVRFVIRSSGQFVGKISSDFRMTFKDRRIKRNAIVVLIRSSNRPIGIFQGFRRFFTSFRVRDRVMVVINCFRGTVNRLFS